MNHFTYHELCHSDTAIRKGIENIPDASQLMNLMDLKQRILELLREAFGRPIYIGVASVNSKMMKTYRSAIILSAFSFFLASFSDTLDCIARYAHSFFKEIYSKIILKSSQYNLQNLPNSGFRCPKLNAAVGGVATSQHMKGQVADIVSKVDGAVSSRSLTPDPSPVGRGEGITKTKSPPYGGGFRWGFPCRDDTERGFL